MLSGLETALTAVTKEWKSEKRRADTQDRLSRAQIQRMTARGREVSIKEAAWHSMPDAYARASGDGQYPATARQIMYAARPMVLRWTGGRCWGSSAYFTQHLLPDYVHENRHETAGWDVVFDARGHFREPHTDTALELGTVEVRRYLREWTDAVPSEAPDYRRSYCIDTRGPANRFRFALFIEKEGFAPLLEQAQIARRFDVAIMSTKGMSNTSSRTLVEALSRAGVTTLVARDFDKAGFSIVHTLRSDTRRFRFAGRPAVVDIGLRLDDIDAMGLESEPVNYDTRNDPRASLRRCGATEEECNFLVTRGNWQAWAGRRVELNAMTSPQIVGWLERKLQELGVEKVVPDADTLVRAYRRSVRMARAEEAIRETLADLGDTEIEVPQDLEGRVRQLLADDTAASWDQVLAALAAKETPS